MRRLAGTDEREAGHEVVLAGSLALAVVLVFAGVAVATERWARGPGLVRARSRLATELGTETVTLSLAERPLTSALLRRSGTEIAVHAEDVPVGDGALLRALEATIGGVRLEPAARTLTTGSGTFTATIDERELPALVRFPGVVSRLELGARGLRVWTILGVGVDADVLVSDGGLRVLPDPAQVAPLLQLPGVGAFRRAIEGRGLWLALPPLPFDAIVEGVRFAPGQVIATGRIPPRSLPLA